MVLIRFPDCFFMSENIILLLETATSSCSVAISRQGEIIAVKERNEQNIHASHITQFIDETMREAGTNYADLDAVAVSKGPGSYTGLRIGVSTAKGLCYALDIPLIGVDTLGAMAYGISKRESIDSHSLLVPMIDARRMEVYMAVYQNDLTVVEPVSAKIIDVESFHPFADQNIILFGDGSTKFQELFGRDSQISFVDFENSAIHMARQATKKLIDAEIEDTAYFEPFYLKDFIAGKPAIG